MRILVSSIIDLNKSQHNRPHQFIRHLSKSHEITVISINDWWKGKQNNVNQYLKEQDISEKVNYHYITGKKISPILQEILSQRAVNRLLEEEKFDVHLNYNTLVTGYQAAKKVNTVFDIADDLSAMIRESPQIPPLLRPVGGAVGDYMIKKNIQVSKRITLTTDNLCKTYNIPENAVEIITNGVDTKLFKDYGPKIKEELGLDGFIIGYVGVLREWIDFEPIFSAIKGLNSDIKILIVGKEGKFWETKELAQRYGIEDRVVFTGEVPYSQVPKYISAMDIGLIPFKKSMISDNAVPLKLFEYMACGKPVLSTRLSGVEKVASNRILYCDNANEYKNNILILYTDQSILKGMGANGRKLVDEGYEWSKISEKLEKMLVDVASS